MDIQGMLNAISEANRRTRTGYHLTLGALIAELEKAAPDAPVTFSNGGAPGDPHSYRGYYSDLSFSSVGATTVGDLLATCRSALDTTFEGYKGGDFLMGADTPLWSAAYGCCGDAIIAAAPANGGLMLITKYIED